MARGARREPLATEPVPSPRAGSSLADLPVLTAEPAIPYLLPAGPLTVILVGCGGTGSHLADVLAKIVTQARAMRLVEPRIALIDGDVVERANVGRQRFLPREVGRNKAAALAGRLAHDAGVACDAYPVMATSRLLGEIVAATDPTPTIIVGAVDTRAARREIARYLLAVDPLYGPDARRRALWVDCGNAELSGQVLAGDTADPRRLARPFLLDGQICAHLPLPALVDVTLVEEPPARPADDASCAAALAAGDQDLLINQEIATIAGRYLAELIVERRLTVWRTVTDLRSLTRQSTRITPRALAAVAADARATIRRLFRALNAKEHDTGA